MKLREWREKAGLTQLELATRAGLDPAQISKWEKWTGGPGAPDLRNALKIERATDGEVPVEEWEDRRQGNGGDTAPAGGAPEAGKAA